jgi:hypothetical protein
MLEYQYRSKVNKVINNDPFYITINPDYGLNSLEQFRYLIKLCFRNISKFYNQTSSKNYLKYVSIIEVNKSITTEKKLTSNKFFIERKNRNKKLSKNLNERMNEVREMGYHTHIFLNSSLKNWIIDEVVIKRIINKVFNENLISIDYYFSKSFYNKERFIDYHLKQLDKLDDNFVLSNLR